MTTTQDTLETNAPRARIVPGGLKANLAANREETLRWVDDAPLRLVAAALLDAPRRQARVGEIENAITGEIIESGGWNRWWNVVRPGVQKSGDFSYPKNKPIRLRATSLAAVDSSSLSELRGSSRASSNGASQSSNGAAATTAKASSGAGKSQTGATPTPDIAGLGGWILWVQADDGEEQPLPKSVPPVQFPIVISKQPKALAGRAISRIASGIEQRVVESNNPSDKTIESWQDALVAGLNRLSGVPDQQDAAIKEAVLITARVAEKHRRSEFQDVVAWMAAYTSVGESAVKAMSDAILSASRISPLGADTLLGRLSKALDSPVRKSLWLELMQSNLTTTRRDAGLLRKWLGMLEAEERADAITYLLGAVQGGDSVKVLDAILRAEWEKSDAEQRARLSDAVALSWQLRRDEPSRNGIYLNGAKPTAQMGTWLKALDAGDRYDVISHLIRAGGDDGMIEAIGPVLETEWKIADADRRHDLFNAVALGWALHDGLRPKARAVMRAALLELAGNGAADQDSRLSELAGVVGEAAGAEVERVREEYEKKLVEKDRELVEKDRELNHANGLIEFLQGEIRTKRQKTELDITREAITILGIALQGLVNSPSPKSDELSDVEARVTLALSTLGVKPVGEIGETVEFDPRLHETDNEPDLGTLVEVTAPGMQFSRRKDNPLNVVKMQVKA